MKADGAARGGPGDTLKTIDGYVADTPYPSNFHSFLQPPWTDWNLERRGIRPPRAPSSAFRYVDLGCGDAFGLIAAAASHPQGQFTGVDAMPEHVEKGRQLIASAGLINVALHCADFAAAAELAEGDADYVVAQGVLAWVSEAARAALLDLASAWLRPGGAFTVGYNAFPGWSEMAGFQRMIAALAQVESGSSLERFDKALAALRGGGGGGDIPRARVGVVRSPARAAAARLFRARIPQRPLATVLVGGCHRGAGRAGARFRRPGGCEPHARRSRLSAGVARNIGENADLGRAGAGGGLA